MLKKIGIVVLALVVLVIGGQAVLYIYDGHPLTETGQFMSGADFAVSEGDDGSFVFRPTNPNGRGIVVMHGALIKPRSYANTAAFFARRGYTVFLPYGGLTRLPINAVDDAAARLAELGIDEWYLIGHSMGGMAALELQRRDAADVRAAALWGSGMPFDYTDVDVPLLFLWADDDGILTAERMESVKKKLPRATRYVTVEGGNHRNFAMYSHQFFDNEGTLDWREQIELANETTAAFFAAAAEDSGR